MIRIIANISHHNVYTNHSQGLLTVISEYLPSKLYTAELRLEFKIVKHNKPSNTKVQIFVKQIRFWTSKNMLWWVLYLSARYVVGVSEGQSKHYVHICKCVKVALEMGSVKTHAEALEYVIAKIQELDDA